MSLAARVLNNRYRLTGRIATGGMGEVWRASDELLGREVAVKLLRQHVAASPEFRERFRNEARITAGLADPRIAQVFDYGEQDDSAYLVMELVPGEPLSAILSRSGTLSVEVTLDVVGQTARALHTAHRSGIIHRDIKPGNLLVTQSGLIKVTDFGIARALEGARMTMTGTVLGTAQYVSPEQASGSPLTPSTDIYSLGVVAYECLAGRPPFTAGNQVAIALLHLHGQVPPLPESVPKPVRDLVTAMLAKSPEHRPADGRELADRAMVLRDSLTTPDDADLSMLTDPSGFAVREASRQPLAERPATPPAWEGLYESPALAVPTSTRIGQPPPGPAQPRTAVSPQRRRRRTIGLVAAAGCAAAVGFGALAAQVLPQLGLDSGPSQPVEPATGEPARSSSPARTSRASLPPQPVKSVKPPVSRSATVSRSAVPTRRRTPMPTPSPTPTPIPTPTPTPTPSETPSPTSSATTAIPPNGET